MQCDGLVLRGRGGATERRLMAENGPWLVKSSNGNHVIA